MLMGHIRAQTLKVLGVADPHPLHIRQGLRDVGLDSLMAVELRNHLQRSTGQLLPTTLAFDYPTVEAIAHFVADTLKLSVSKTARGAVATTSVRAEVQSLTDAEAEALLLSELSELRATEERGSV